jgi:hypothetical protein
MLMISLPVRFDQIAKLMIIDGRVNAWLKGYQLYENESPMIIGHGVYWDGECLCSDEGPEDNYVVTN